MHAQRCRHALWRSSGRCQPLLPLAFLSAQIVDAVLTGQQPVDLSVQHLTRNIELPVIWADHARTLGI
jgi:hypothetical protein